MFEDSFATPQKGPAVAPRPGLGPSGHPVRPCRPGLPHLPIPLYGQDPALLQGIGPHRRHRAAAQCRHSQSRRGARLGGPARRPLRRRTARTGRQAGWEGPSGARSSGRRAGSARRGGPGRRRRDGAAAGIGLGHPLPLLEIPGIDRHPRQVRPDHPARPAGHPGRAARRRGQALHSRTSRTTAAALIEAGSADMERAAAAAPEAAAPEAAASGWACPFRSRAMT